MRAFFIILVFAIFLSAALSAPSPAYAKEHSNLKNKTAIGLLEKAKASPDARARIIIKMKSAPDIVGVSSYSVQSKEHAKTESILKNKKIMKHSNNSDIVAAEIPLSALDSIASEESVEYIEEDKTVHAFLSESIPLTGANSIWMKQIEGINVTGAGTSICVIDTGVDYTHPDLGGCTKESFLAGNCSKVINGYDFCGDSGSCGSSPEDDDPADNNGHGTHVSGIAAANGILKGVAPDAKIVAIKALNASGDGYESDIISGIDWCVSNSTKFNISVISMSLGGESYASYCDSDNPVNMALAESINSAAAKNISVVAATGNGAKATAIAVPACIKNATRVGATTKSDAIASFTNRGSDFPDMLLAPGVRIYSTYKTAGYASLDGTSMSTPHVSGAIALLSQAYKTIYGAGETPRYFEDLLNSTGKQINDAGGTNLNFSRIDVLAAYNMLISNVPGTIITIHSPQNKSFTNANYSIINASQTAESPMNFSIDGKKNGGACSSCSSFANSSGFLEDGLHNITVYGSNSVGAISYETVYFTVDATHPVISFGNATKENNSIIDKPWIFANLSIIENNFANATASLFNSSGIIDSTAIDDKNNSGVNWTGLAEGTYYFNATAYDKAGNSNSTETRKVTIDLMPPAISNISILPAAVHTGDNATITYSIADISPVESNISIAHGNISESVSFTHSKENYTAVFTNVSNAGEYNITIFAKDAVNRTSNKSKTLFANAAALLSLNSVGDNSITLLIKREDAETKSISAAAEEKNESFDTGNYTIEARGENDAFAISLNGVEFAPNEILKIFFSNISATSPDAAKYRFIENAFSFSPEFNFSSATVCLKYTGYAGSFLNASRARNFKCNGTCEDGNWTLLETSVNEATNQSCSNVSSFSSFVLGEILPYCGNGNVDSGETCNSCPVDAGACPPPPAETPKSRGSSGGYGGGIIAKAKNITNATNASVSLKTNDKNISNAGNISSKAKDNSSIIKNNSSEKINAPEIKIGLEESKNISETREPIIITGYSVVSYLEPITSLINWLIHSLMKLL